MTEQLTGRNIYIHVSLTRKTKQCAQSRSVQHKTKDICSLPLKSVELHNGNVLPLLTLQASVTGPVTIARRSPMYTSPNVHSLKFYRFPPHISVSLFFINKTKKKQHYSNSIPSIFTIFSISLLFGGSREGAYSRLGP